MPEIALGGAGSGNFGHAGRIGEVGGSGPGDGLGSLASKDLSPATIGAIEHKLAAGAVVYRGERKSGRGPADPGDFGVGLYYSTSAARAKNYGRLTAVKLRMENPLVLSSSEAYDKLTNVYNTVTGSPEERKANAEKLTAALTARGHDGIAVVNTKGGEIEYVRFPSADDGETFYHGTVSEQLDSIKREGLRTDHSGLAWPGLSQPGTIYLARDKDMAMKWAESTALRLSWKFDNPRAVVLKVRIPRGVKGHRTAEPEGNLRVRENIRPEWIVDVVKGRTKNEIEKHSLADDGGDTYYVGVVLEDGGDQSLTFAELVALAEWDESLHPRADDGKFTDGAGGDHAHDEHPSKLTPFIEQAQAPDGGFTFHASASWKQPHDGYAVSVFKGRERVVDAKSLTPKDLVKYIKDNWDLLRTRKNYLGGWHNPDDDKVYLDVSRVVKDEAEAQRLAREYDQLAYFDFKNMRSVPTPKAVAAAEWNEDEHPRAEDGKFASGGGGGGVFHGTSASKLKSILKNGLVGDWKKAYDISRKGVYLASNRSEAEYWARSVAFTDKDDEIAILEVVIPKSAAKNLKADTNFPGGKNIAPDGDIGRMLLYGGNIRPEWIKKAWLATAGAQDGDDAVLRPVALVDSYRIFVAVKFGKSPQQSLSDYTGSGYGTEAADHARRRGPRADVGDGSGDLRTADRPHHGAGQRGVQGDQGGLRRVDRDAAARGTSGVALARKDQPDPEAAAEDDPDWIEHLTASARISAQSVADNLLAKARQEALRLRRADWTDDEIEEALKIHLGELSDADIARVASQEINEAFSLGRTAASKEFKDEVDRVVYSAILDANVCPVCEALDGQEFEIDSDEYEENMPPNKDCKGGDSCRCTYIYLLKDKSDDVEMRERALAEWDESQHPRDETGKFTDAGGGDTGEKAEAHDFETKLLAGATPSNAQSIGGHHANAVMRVELNDGTSAIFKPESGEAWTLPFANGDINQHVTNRDFSLAEREAAAYEVDSIVGTDLVPETVLRESFPVGDPEPDPDSEDSGGGFDEDELRTMYDEYREKAFDAAAENAGDRMGSLYNAAKDEHVDDIKARADEMADIWNNLIDEHPEFEDVGKYGSRTEVARHPTLPIGTEGGVPITPFERGKVGGEVDPIDVLDEAKVDVSSKMSERERSEVEKILLERLRDGAQTLGSVDTMKAQDHLSYGDWIEGHADTENRYIDEGIMSFTAWRNENGYNLSSDGGGSTVKNTRAPHPGGGSLQRYVDDLDEYGSLDLERGDYHRFAVLDYLIGSMDRHGGNVFYNGQGKPLGMDNGYSFPDSNDVHFRSHPASDLVSYGRGDRQEAIRTPDKLREKWLANLNKTDWNKFVDRHKSMSVKERAAFLDRVSRMKKALSTPDGLFDLWDDTRLIY